MKVKDWSERYRSRWSYASVLIEYTRVPLDGLQFHASGLSCTVFET